ncbi:MAG: hypothetical protein IJU98_09910 [Synergistaceae bacterium]|nr:hypothetical protein [Synergistaceae bacterium]
MKRVAEDCGDLDSLERKGLLLCRDDVYCLSEEGRRAFSRISAELFLYEEPGDAPDNPAAYLMTTELWIELERCNLQRGGLKRYLFRPQIPVRPALRREDVWSLDGGRLLWKYPDSPAVKELLEKHPLPRPHERKPELPDAQALREWRELSPEPFVPDLAYIAHYDFTQYLDFKGHPGDDMKLINTDRFFFSTAGDRESRLDVLGQFQRWLLELRHLKIPGYLDLDTQEQDSVNWLIFLTRTQEEALEVQADLRQFGPSLIEPANPMEVWTLSLEALRTCPSQRELIWDVLPEAGQPVCLTL